MPSFLMRCIPCVRTGKVPISEQPVQPEQPLSRVVRKTSSQPVERALHYDAFQQTPVTVRARGYEEIALDTMGTGNGSGSDTKYDK